jgi:hypothetical protein
MLLPGKAIWSDLVEAAVQWLPGREVPNLLMCPTGALLQEPVTTLDDPERWDLHSVCGRSWR